MTALICFAQEVRLQPFTKAFAKQTSDMCCASHAALDISLFTRFTFHSKNGS